MSSYKLDFSSCRIVPGFGKSKHNSLLLQQLTTRSITIPMDVFFESYDSRSKSLMHIKSISLIDSSFHFI